jgi:hypothetical protein
MNDVSWEGFQSFLEQNAKSCVKWLPLMRDGEVEFQPAHARLTAQGEVETVKLTEIITIRTAFRVDLATTTKTDWLAECQNLQVAYPALSRGGKSGVKATLIRDDAGVVAYDSGNGYFRSIGGQLEKYRASLAEPPVPIVPAPVPIAQAPVPVAHAMPMMAQPLALPTVPAVPAPSAEPVNISVNESIAPIEIPSKSAQLLRTCGRCMPLIGYLKRKNAYEFMSKKQFNCVKEWARTVDGVDWLKAAGLDPNSFHVHHINAESRGGYNSCYNFAFVPGYYSHNQATQVTRFRRSLCCLDSRSNRNLNSSWRERYSEEMVKFVGEDACRLAAAHARFIERQVARGVSQSKFDPNFALE